MAETIRFPFLFGHGGVGPKETNFVIDIFAGSTLHIGGEQNYVPLTPWKVDENATEAPFPCVVIEFLTDAPIVIGSGADPICVFGEIWLTKQGPAGATKRQILGMLGMNYAATNVPQIPVIQQAGPGNNIVGFSQVVSNVACYDALSIGTVNSNLSLVVDDEAVNLIVTARPIRQRVWMG